MRTFIAVELPESLRLYFLVQQSEQFRFKMAGVSFDRQDGCPGESEPSFARPSLLSVPEKKR